MSNNEITLRDSVESDVPAIQAIYAYHVLNGTASFEIEPPSVEDMRGRRADVLSKGLPYIVAERDGAVVGYAYATLYRARPAYRFTCEDSVYVHEAMARQGVGGKLLAEIIRRCTAGGWRQMIAVIGDNNAASMAVHASQGFFLAGTLHNVGFKFEAWRDTAMMQRALGDGADTPAPDGGR